MLEVFVGVRYLCRVFDAGRFLRVPRQAKVLARRAQETETTVVRSFPHFSPIPALLLRFHISFPQFSRIF